MRSPHFGTENNLIKPGNIRALHSVLVFFTLLLLTLPSTPAFGDEYWRTTRFKVFTGNPFVGTEWAGTWLDLEDEDSRPSEATISAIETAFSEAASWYKRNGFPAPRLLPLIETDEGPAYQVYLCSSSNQSGWETFWREQGYGGRVFANLPWGRCGFNPPPGRTSSGAYKTLCGHDSDRTRIMYINRDKAVTGIGLNESGYQTIAHELMHAIIANTPFGRSFSDGDSCEINKWITEGIADAISYDIMDELWQGQYQPYTNSKAVIKQYGYRPYVESLTKSEEVPIPGLTI